MLLPLVAILYITSLGLVYLITGSLYLLTLFTDFTYPHPNSGNHQSVLCICEPEVLLLLLFLKSMYHKIIWYLSFSVWLMSFNIVPSRCIYIITKGKTSFSLWLNHAPLCVCVCVCTYHIFCIHSSVSRHLGPFHVWLLWIRLLWILRMHISFWGEGNGNPLQYSCLENPMGGAW